jgi:hypothetical protein
MNPAGSSEPRVTPRMWAVCHFGSDFDMAHAVLAPINPTFEATKSHLPVSLAAMDLVVPTAREPNEAYDMGYARQFLGTLR